MIEEENSKHDPFALKQEPDFDIRPERHDLFDLRHEFGRSRATRSLDEFIDEYGRRNPRQDVVGRRQEFKRSRDIRSLDEFTCDFSIPEETDPVYCEDIPFSPHSMSRPGSSVSTGDRSIGTLSSLSSGDRSVGTLSSLSSGDRSVGNLSSISSGDRSVGIMGLFPSRNRSFGNLNSLPYRDGSYGNFSSFTSVNRSVCELNSISAREYIDELGSTGDRSISALSGELSASHGSGGRVTVRRKPLKKSYSLFDSFPPANDSDSGNDPGNSYLNSSGASSSALSMTSQSEDEDFIDDFNWDLLL